MAGEVRGELAEAIAKVAIERFVRRQRARHQVFWEERPCDAVINPDLTIGAESNRPIVVVLVNASDSPKESEKKYWRNIGETFDCKSRLTPAPLVFNLVFKSEIKPELIRLTSSLCDGTHLVDIDPTHGERITHWIESQIPGAPSKKGQKEQLVRNAMSRGSDTYDSGFTAAVSDLSQALASTVYKSRSELAPLWDLVKKDFESRQKIPARTAKTTMLRRGLARWLVFDETIRPEVLAAHLAGNKIKREQIPPYSKLLKMVMARTGGAVIYPDPSGSDKESMTNTVGRDLRMAATFFMKAASGDVNHASDALCSALEQIPEEMRRAAAIIRQMPSQVEQWHTFAMTHWADLCSPDGCYRLLTQCFSDPTMAGEVPNTTGGRVWLYDHLIATLRAADDKNNDFGYGRLMSHFKDAYAHGRLLPFLKRILSTLDAGDAKKSKRWIETTLPKAKRPGERGLLEWLKGEKQICGASVACYAFALAELINEIKQPGSLDISELTSRHAYGLWNKLLTHQDFEPLAELIEAACGERVTRDYVGTVMADLAAKAVQNAGKMPAYAFKGGLICWQSVTDAGKDHKRKELCGRSRALRFQKTHSGFRTRDIAQKLFLVIDGTFNDDDLRVLQEAGWDRLFYPDEMDALAKAIQ